MLSPDLEINRLRWNLSNKGWQSQELDAICDQAAADINTIILDVVSGATAEAIEYAEAIGADDFIDDLDIVESGSIFQIRTRSGKTDYSRSRKEMLQHLLKNAKTAQDGSKYKVIPMRDKQKFDIGTSMFDTMKKVDAAQQEAKTAIVDNNQNNRSARANQMAYQFRQSMKRSMLDDNKKVNDGPVTGFRTASSKQNADTQWVIPEKDVDMTQFLAELNNRIEDTIEQSVVFIIKSYEEEYA